MNMAQLPDEEGNAQSANILQPPVDISIQGIVTYRSQVAVL